MPFNHLWGLYAQPLKTWQRIHSHHEALFLPWLHLLFIAFIPVASAYYSAVYLGWETGLKTVSMAASSAFFLASMMYLALILGVLALAYLTSKTAFIFHAQENFKRSFELITYTVTPLFMAGLAVFYAELWFIACVFLIGLAYSIYLLYTGVPILMELSEEQGFMYASTIVMMAGILLVAFVIATIIAWSNGFAPQFIY